MSAQAILCVDDEAIILLSLVQELKKEFGDAFMYVKATDADLAFQVIEDLVAEGTRIILIISDWLMPGIKGDEFLEIVRRKYPDIKAVMITGHADDSAMEKMRSNGSILAVLKKPWNSKELMDIISQSCLPGGKENSHG